MLRLKGNIKSFECCSLKICSAVANRSKELGKVLQRGTQAFKQDRWDRMLPEQSRQEQGRKIQKGQNQPGREPLRLLGKLLPAKALRGGQNAIGVWMRTYLLGLKSM